MAPDRFKFLNEERPCRTAQDWRPADASPLWAYNLHYFDDLNAQGARERSAWHVPMLERWVAENPPGSREGWASYPVSRRIVNWVKWAAAGNTLSAGCHASLAVQARWLAQRLEHHLLGNHLLVNAKALMHAGRYFEGGEADEWHALGAAILDRELQEQILPDGGHFERSPMYHAAILEDLLDLLNLARACLDSVPASLLDAIALMRSWLAVMSHPDGEVAFFNDAAIGIAPTLAELEEYAIRLGLPAGAAAPGELMVLGSSGYVRAAQGPACLICDCGEVGPAYLPAHAHADTLSLELSVAGRRVLVNSGTSVYGNDAERQRQRGTAAHNTVVVDGQDSTEVWAGFRVARRAHACLHEASASASGVRIAASHDGYRRLRSRADHVRACLLRADSLRIEDKVTGTPHTAEAFFHFHPDFSAEHARSQEVTLSTGAGAPMRLRFEGAAAVEIRPTTWHPQFGLAVPATVVVARFAGAALDTELRWAP